MLDVLLLTLGITLIVIGLIGCIIPVIPGPPLSFLGMLSLEYTRWGNFDSDLLWTFGLIALVVTVLDYIVPIWGTKKFGGSKAGIWGASIGLLIGLFLGPLGIIFGPFVGAFIGELTQNTESNKALLAALGSFVGLLTGILLKLTASGFITYYFIVELFA
ncbi:MAG: DUF456 domain-containing protein [Salinivirgaceae bacterium]|nr:DUF456 domain-containing protein [Salinivirgaceae bacterium]